MTDTALQKLMDSAYDACLLHIQLLKKVEEEYKRRYGSFPSDWDDDFFIDTFSYGAGKRMTISEMKEHALFQKK